MANTALCNELRTAKKEEPIRQQISVERASDGNDLKVVEQ